jgi:hypothetical protein
VVEEESFVKSFVKEGDDMSGDRGDSTGMWNTTTDARGGKKTRNQEKTSEIPSSVWENGVRKKRHAPPRLLIRTL